ncbi:MAG: hypothetical protein K6T77_00910 [candidate division WOR-3 bacterium]|nr:hypothetical protein [candidate division WOR-3 bacterium]MCR4424549.1 hypothetical protein [candidate division WOR-3 bacterium]MDH7519315.1 hypothetical protein [bacterium]
MPVIMMAVGGLGLAAQVVILRELLAAFAGNEVSSGVFLSIWLLSEGLGAWLFSQHAAHLVTRKYSLTVLGFVSALSSTTASALVVYARRFLGLLPGENLSLQALFLITLLVVFLPGATHGALFVLGTALRKERGVVARVYFYEGLGTVLTAVVLYFGLLSRVPNLGIVALMGAVLMGVLGVVMIVERRSLIEGVLALGGGVFLLYFLTIGMEGERWLWEQTWQGQRVLGVRDSPYAKLVTVEREGQRQLLYDGSVALVVPNPDVTGVEEMAHIPLLLHPAPQRVLILGMGLGGLVGEILKWPVTDVQMVVLDRWLIDEARRTGGRLVAEEIADPRVKVVALDARQFLKRTVDSFDCIIITDAAPENLGANRLFTMDFFRLCRSRLKANGILATRTPGTFEGLQPAALEVLKTRYGTLCQVFPKTELVALDFPLLVAGERLETSPESVVTRWERMGIDTRVLTPAYLAGLLNPFRQAIVKRKLTVAPPNTDLVPRELFLNMVWEHQRSSPGFSRFYGTLPNTLRRLLLPVVGFLLSAVLGVVLWGRKTQRVAPARGLGIFTSGFAGAGVSLLTIFVYASRFGSVYTGVALLLASFMFGSVLGAGLINRWCPKRPAAIFALFDLMILMSTGTVWFLVKGGGQIFFFLLVLVVGICLGGQFALASEELTTMAEPRRAGYLTVLDWAGGAAGGFVMALGVLPIAGVIGAVGLIALFKLASAVSQLLTNRKYNFTIQRV